MDRFTFYVDDELLEDEKFNGTEEEIDTAIRAIKELAEEE